MLGSACGEWVAAQADFQRGSFVAAIIRPDTASRHQNAKFWCSELSCRLSRYARKRESSCGSHSETRCGCDISKCFDLGWVLHARRTYWCLFFVTALCYVHVRRCVRIIKFPLERFWVKRWQLLWKATMKPDPAAEYKNAVTFGEVRMPGRTLNVPICTTIRSFYHAAPL